MGECITVECLLIFKKTNLNKIIISQFKKGRRFQWKKFLIVMQNFISFRASSQAVIKKSFVTRTKTSHTLRLTSKDEKFVDGVVCWAVKQKLTSNRCIIANNKTASSLLHRSTAKKIQFSTFAIMNETNEQEEIAWKNQFHGYLLNNSTHSLTPPRKWLICCQHLPDVRIKINSSRWLYLVTSSSTFLCLCRTLEDVFNFWVENIDAWNDFGHKFRSEVKSL